RVRDALGTDKFTVALPANRNPIPRNELLDFASEAQPERIHLLGLGDQEKVDDLREAIQEATGQQTIVTGDSTQIRKLVGKGRAVTEAVKEQQRESGATGPATGLRAKEFAKQQRRTEPGEVPVWEYGEGEHLADVSEEQWRQMARWVKDRFGDRELDL